MTNEERLRAAGWRRVDGTNPPSSCEWSRDGIDWYTEDEALVVALTAERDAAIARAEEAEALAASRPEITPNISDLLATMLEVERACRDDGESYPLWWDIAVPALRAHAAKVSR